MRLAALLSLLLLLNVPTPTLAADATPKEVVIDYLAAWKNEGLPATAPLFSPASHKEIAGMMRDLLFAGPPEQSAAMREALLGPNSTKDAVAAMPNADLMKTFLLLNDMSMKRMRSGIEVKSYSVLGSVEENSKLVHVVARTKMSVADQELDRVSVFSTEKVDGTWYIGMQTDMAAALRAMKRQLATQPAK